MAKGYMFNADIDPRLLRALESVQNSKYAARGQSGYRPGDPRYHGKHSALDIILSDRETGADLANYQDPTTFHAYQQYANDLYRWALENDPSLAEDLRWGGYFSGGKGKYGALDVMHFDTGAKQTPMGGGSWAEGLKPEQAELWDLASGGGINEALAAAGYTPEQRRAAIASIESAGSGDYGAVGAWTGEGMADRDRAYGRYQVMGNNIAPWAKQYLGMDNVTSEMFMADPALQDKLFDAVYGDYVKQYGERGAASKWFTGSEKEPDRTDVNGVLTGKTYADKYMDALGLQSTGGGMVTGNTSPSPGFTPKKPDDKKKKGGWADALSSFGEGMGDMGGATTPNYNLPDSPRAVLASNVPTTIDTGGGDEKLRRAELTALIMKRLNSGSLA